MMKWKHALIAGCAIILLTNAVALGGAAYNRSGEAESRLQLTQRELGHSYSYAGREDSGIALSLNWRFDQPEQAEFNYALYAGRWGMPVWLDRAKLAQLGFGVEKLSASPESGQSYLDHETREVLLVLELDGAAWQKYLLRLSNQVDERRKLLAAAPDSKELQDKLKSAEDSFRHEQKTGSRLFVVDAGLELASLRASYPDRSRYAIVRGLIRLGSMYVNKQTVIGGYITELHSDQINVPLDFRQAFDNGSSFQATVAFGQRLEPWLESASKIEPVKESQN
ncbi:MAG: DUF4824 family protein [Sideroxydans sp.]|nr:DUF4824 family protein [Sideroxydans sp.]